MIKVSPVIHRAILILGSDCSALKFIFRNQNIDSVFFNPPVELTQLPLYAQTCHEYFRCSDKTQYTLGT